MSKKNAITKKCSICENEYLIRADRAETSKYCSKECWNKRRVLKKCLHCNIDITSYHGKKYCSKKCSELAHVGENSTRWIDGKSLERDRARLGSEVKEWRKKVYMRDNYTCQHCSRKGKIHAHHIIEWAKDESQRFNVDNGITLCVDCHGKIHGVDFTHRDKKTCGGCDKKIKRESNFCHSCATKNQWAKKKLDPNLTVKINGQPYKKDVPF